VTDHDLEGRESHVSGTRNGEEEEQVRHRLLPVSDIPQTGSISADLLGREVLVTLVNGKPRAYINVCQHHGGPLVLEGDRFTCEWHGSQFDARTGHALSGPVRPDARLIMLPTRVEEGTLVYVYDEKEGNERLGVSASAS
jgi:nitrite reductase/ring-hydroxylating ferredoxin subunit